MKESYNRLALITGGARRMGRDIAISLAKDGIDVIINYYHTPFSEVRKTVNEIINKGVKCESIKADISKPLEIKRMFEKIMKNYGKLDILINNAAIFDRYGLFDFDEKIFDKFINTNLKSVVFCTQYAAELMIKNKKKPCSIINISSLGGIQNWHKVIPYSLAKTSVIKFTKLSAKELAPDILVNSIAPGTIWIENDENKTARGEEARLYPMKRLGTKNDINSIIKYLVNDNKYITGNIFKVDGGRSL